MLFTVRLLVRNNKIIDISTDLKNKNIYILLNTLENNNANREFNRTTIKHTLFEDDRHNVDLFFKHIFDKIEQGNISFDIKIPDMLMIYIGTIDETIINEYKKFDFRVFNGMYFRRVDR